VGSAGRVGRAGGRSRSPPAIPREPSDYRAVPGCRKVTRPGGRRFLGRLGKGRLFARPAGLESAEQVVCGVTTRTRPRNPLSAPLPS